MKIAIAITALAGACGAALAGPVVSDYEDLDEGFYGTEFNHNGVTYRNVNNQAGFYPDGEAFEAGDLSGEVVIENAGLLYNDFPEFGSPVNAMTFGGVLVPGENLSIGALSTVTMDLDTPANAASVELAYYENGPWGGIVYQFDALLNGQVVASESFVIAGADGRDNIAFHTFNIDGVEFDSLNLYATLNGEFTAPRGMIDNLSITPIPAPASLVAFAGLAGMAARRRR
ncbi:MAG: hypothetical protein ACFHWZ_17300 [Phycisphaerales bacterium]